MSSTSFYQSVYPIPSYFTIIFLSLIHIFVVVTEQGRRILEEIHRIFEQWDELCYTGFTEEEKKLYQDFVRRIAENVMNCRHREGDDNDGK